MTHTVFIDLDSHVATASASGTAAPNVPLKHLTKQTLAFAFHSGGTVQAVTGWDSGRVIVKATPTSDVLLLDTTLAVTGSTTSTRYSAEWASADCDSAAMRTLIGASTEPLDVWAEIQWTDADGTYAVAFPIQIVPTFNLPEDDPPDPVADASWAWLKARLAAGTNVTFSDNDTTKVRTIAAALSEVAWSAITGTPTTLSGYGITDAQPLAANLTTLAAGGSPLATSVVIWDNVDQQYEFGFLPISSLASIANNTVLGNVSGGTTQPSAITASDLRTMLSISNVENTALSTWAGSANITTLGTIASGTWQGSVIAPAYLGTGSDITTKFLRGDGTWQAVSSGITINTTAITGGTSGRVLYNNGGVVGELTTTGSGSVVLSASPSLSGDVRTVNGSNYLSMQWSGFAAYDNAVGFKFRLNAADPIVSGGAAMHFGALGAITWQSTTRQDAGTADLQIWRHAAGALIQRVGTSAQQFLISNTYTSATNYEAAVFDWQTTANTLRIGTDVGSGGGSSRALAIITGGTARINVGASGELGFFGATAIAKPTVTGAHGGNAALQSLIAAMANLGFITDSTS